jgi:hypothetical protein
MEIAPVALFSFKRPLHTKATMEALLANNFSVQTKIYIFIDGLNSNASKEDAVNHSEVVSFINSFQWPCEKEVFVNKENKGLAASIVEGVSYVLEKHNRVIVLEDDLVTSPYFLEYMNDALKKYVNDQEVACISGYVYPLKKKFDSAFFVKGADCWGWATWQEKWKSIFDDNPEKLLEKLSNRKLSREFNFNDSYPYVSMLKDRVNGKNQSWAVLWYASAFLQNKLCLYPPVSLVHNIGNDGSGTHTNFFTDRFDSDYESAYKPILPDEITENKYGRIEFETFFRNLTSMKKTSWTTRLKDRIKSFLYP